MLSVDKHHVSKMKHCISDLHYVCHGNHLNFVKILKPVSIILLVMMYDVLLDTRGRGRTQSAPHTYIITVSVGFCPALQLITAHVFIIIINKIKITTTIIQEICNIVRFGNNFRYLLKN